MKGSQKAFLASALFIFTASCEKEKNIHNIGSTSTTRSESNTDSKQETTAPPQGMLNQVSPTTSNISLADGSDHRSWIGKVLHIENKNLFEKWAEDLSRNPNEKRHRKLQLAHLRRAEVLAWNISHQDLQLVRRGDAPTKIELPFFGEETLTVLAEEVRRAGEQSTYLEGYLASDPESKVYLNLANQDPTIVIEGPNDLIYYEAFEDVVILRENEPGSQNADFDCDCEHHQAVQ